VNLPFALLLTVACLVGGTGRAAAGPITFVNPSFEQVVIGSPFKSSNAADVPGWTHTGVPGDALLWRTGYNDGSGTVTVAGEGSQFVTMGGGYGPTGLGTWEQALTGFVVGESYTLDFMMVSEAFDGPFTFPAASTMTIVVSLIGINTVSSNFTATNDVGNYWKDWESKSFSFVADSSNLTLRFAYNGPYDVGLDNVRINNVSQPVAEPATLWILALGLVAAARRRRP
jgi:hypothetical protein